MLDRKVSSSPPSSLAESGWQYDWAASLLLLLVELGESGGAVETGLTKAAASPVSERTAASTRADDGEYIIDLDRLPVFIDTMAYLLLLPLK